MEGVLIPEAHRLARLRSFRDIRAAVAGTGFIGVVHVEALRRLGVEVTGIVGSSRTARPRRRGAHNLPEPYESLEAMLADERVDVVHLATPNHLHDEQVRAALAAGKHVVCEKPLGMNSVQTGELVALAEASGLVHAVNFNQRFYPKNLHAREAIARGRPRRRADDHRRLRAGLAALRHRLELAAGARAGRRPARGGGHRLALAGPRRAT